MIQLLQTIKHWYQRAKRGYSYQDLWSFNSYLSSIIPPALREYNKNVSGCPGDLYDESKINDGCHKWKEILEEIAQGFEAAEEMKNIHFLYRKDNPDRSHSFEYDEKRAQYLVNKFERGIDLFKKYYFSLWD
jgi:hypothetical protein